MHFRGNMLGGGAASRRLKDKGFAAGRQCQMNRQALGASKWFPWLLQIAKAIRVGTMEHDNRTNIGWTWRRECKWWESLAHW